VDPPLSVEAANIEEHPLERLVKGLRQTSTADASSYAAELIRRFEPLLRRAWHQGAFHVDYQDFVQDVFLRLFQSLPTLRHPRAFPGFFRRVALSVAVSHARKAARQESNTAELVQQVDRFDERLLSHIFVRSYLEELPPREREVASLFFLQDLSAGDIARLLALTPSAVRATKSRAANHLRQILRREAGILEKEAGKA
jgi:RNA polymerase sigma-70 factor (ECF subfamily)